jgi:hypothetical protein
LIQLRFFALCDHQTARFQRDFLPVELDASLSVAGRTGGRALWAKGALLNVPFVGVVPLSSKGIKSI